MLIFITIDMAKILTGSVGYRDEWRPIDYHGKIRLAVWLDPLRFEYVLKWFSYPRGAGKWSGIRVRIGIQLRLSSTVAIERY